MEIEHDFVPERARIAQSYFQDNQFMRDRIMWFEKCLLEGKAASQAADTNMQEPWWGTVFREYNQVLGGLPSDPKTKRSVIMNGFDRGMVVAHLTAIYAYTVTNSPIKDNFEKYTLDADGLERLRFGLWTASVSEGTPFDHRVVKDKAFWNFSYLLATAINNLADKTVTRNLDFGNQPEFYTELNWKQAKVEALVNFGKNKVYRGIHISDEVWKKMDASHVRGKYLLWLGFSSTSLCEKNTYPFLLPDYLKEDYHGVSVLYEITHRRGKVIYQHELEVMLNVFTVLRVTNVTTKSIWHYKDRIIDVIYVECEEMCVVAN